jgi:type IV pilus assembly protein PilC
LAGFNYVVIDKAGKEKKGSIQADSQAEAKDKLKSDGFTVISVSKSNAFNQELNISIGGKVKPRDLSIFCRQFISMVNAGVTILDTLDMLAEQTENKTMAKAIRGVHAEIRKGESFSEAIKKYPNVFPDIMCSMVAAGEASGKIDVAFERMASHFEKSAKLKAIVKKAMVYPIMLIAIALIVVVVMLVKVIPGYQEMFESMGTDLPGITKAVVAASDFIMAKWYIILIVIAAAVFGISTFKKTIPGQVFFGNLGRKMPVFGNLTIKQAASNYSRTLSTLIYSGLSMMEALTITSNTMSNYIYKQALAKAREDVAKGVPLSEPITQCGLFPPMVGHMTKVGEETGDLEGMLTRLADYYDEEVEMATQTVLAAMEPMIILVMAGVVCVLVAAIMAPMLKMYDSLNSL